MNSQISAHALPKTRSLIILTLAAVGLLCFLMMPVVAQNTQTTENKADQNLKSSARINPVTLAMEFSLPLGGYPGRGGNSIPISLNYSSKVWEMKRINSRHHTDPSTDNDYDHFVYNTSDIGAFFAKKTISGWTSSLQPVAFIDEPTFYNYSGEFLDIFVPNFSASFQRLDDGATCSVSNIHLEPDLACGSGLRWTADITCVGATTGHIYIYQSVPGVCAYDDGSGGGSNGGGGPFPWPSPSPIPINPTPTPESPYAVNRVHLQMPDGSSHEFRKDDTPHGCGDSAVGCGPSDNGTYLATDGSAMRLERKEVQPNNETKDVLYLPNGSRYYFSQPDPGTGMSSLVADKFVDANGNVERYDALHRTWTDTLSREVDDPLFNGVGTQRPGVGPQNYKLKGIDNASLGYVFNWDSLANVFEQPEETIKHLGSDNCHSYVPSAINGDALFTIGISDVENDGRTRYITTQRVCASPRGWGGNDAFNPVVLSSVSFPNGQRYQFKYNEYGEITKIIYPTGSYERFEYGSVQPVGVTALNVYTQANRGVVKRFISPDGTAETQQWSYGEFADDGGQRIETIAPDGTKSERIIWASTDSRFGFEDPREGMPKEEVVKDANGNLRSRTLNDWIALGPQGENAFPDAARDARPKRSVTFTFEPGSNSALATLSETEYESPGSGGAPSDPSYFSHLNAKRKKAYQYVAVPVATATSSTNWDTIESWFTQDKLASVSETDYSYSADYRSHGIVGLPTETRIMNPLDPGGTPLAVTQTVYDNALPGASSSYGYSMQQYGTGNAMDCASNPQNPHICWQNPNGPSGSIDLSYRGLSTTTRLWNSDSQTWIESQTQYDQFGNAVKAKDPLGNEISKELSSDNKYAFPTRVTAPAPDPSNTHGTNQTSTVQTTYDFTTGLPLSVTDDFGQVTTREYDASLRPIRVNPVVVSGNATGPRSETIYGQPDSNGQLTSDHRFVKVRKQLDANNWDEATTWFDGLGRTIKTQAKDSQGDVFVETHYDDLGRVDRVTNPYRIGDPQVYWSKTRYDELGRVVETYAPEPPENLSNAKSLGVTSFDISTVPGYFGTAVETKDAANKRSRSITNALGQLIVVEEPDSSGNLQPLPQSTPLPSPTPTPTPGPSPTPIPTPTPGGGHGGCLANCPQNFAASDFPSYATYYTYNVQGKLVQVTQGGQNRYFKYDSLGRLIRVSQPEQERNQSLDLPDSYNTLGYWTAGFTYDVLGNVITATDAKGTVITNAYDRAGRVITRTYSHEPTGITTPTVNFYYDGKGLDTPQSPNFAKGKLTKVDNGTSATEYMTFDNFGRLTRTRQITDGVVYGDDTNPITYQYNLSGALVQETYPSGRVVKNEFESDGDLADVTSQKAGTGVFRPYVSDFSYTASGGISQMRLGNGRYETAKFNKRLQVTDLGLGNSATDAGLWQTHYDYGELDASGNVDDAKNTGNIAKQTLNVPGASFVQQYKYDSLYRLTEAKERGSGATPNWVQNWTYDRYGNRTNFTQSLAGVANDGTPAVDASTNRFTDTSFHYDKNGNVVQDVDSLTSQSRTFTFNGDNKQIGVKNANGDPVGQYFYDGEGKRVKKVTNTETTVFVYSAGKLVAEYSTQIASQGHTNYTTTDHLGSPRIITDELGQVTARRDFMPFGEDIFANVGARTTALNYGATADNLRQKFTGYQKDNETDLDFAEARMYENRFGRFTAVDPLLASGKNANPQTFNRYTYCLNDPVNCVDPIGLDGFWAYRHMGGGYWQFQYFNTQEALDEMNEKMKNDNCEQIGCSPYERWKGGEFVINGDRTGLRLLADGNHEEFSLAAPWASDQEYADLLKAQAAGGGLSEHQLNGLNYAQGMQHDIAESDAAVDSILERIDRFLNGNPNYKQMNPEEDVEVFELLIAYRKALRGVEEAREVTGAYVHEFESGKTYVGKGTMSRMEQTGKELSERNGDKLRRSTFIASKTNTSKESFVMEHLEMMKQTRPGPLSADRLAPTYNKIFSPGKRYWEAFLDETK